MQTAVGNDQTTDKLFCGGGPAWICSWAKSSMGTGPLGSIALAWAWVLTYHASLLVFLVLRLILRVMLHLLKVSADQDAET